MHSTWSTDEVNKILTSYHELEGAAYNLAEDYCCDNGLTYRRIEIVHLEYDSYANDGSIEFTRYYGSENRWGNRCVDKQHHSIPIDDLFKKKRAKKKAVKKKAIKKKAVKKKAIKKKAGAK